MLMLRITPATVEVSFSGRAKTAFRRNRIGLVVLHPTSEAGRDVSVVSPDGNVTAGAFPTDIRPDLVFTDISSLEWADAGTAFDLGFSGDIFETEDQRNWSDGSFKTYSTPSALPIPVDVAAGDTVTQSVSIEALSIETPDNPAPRRLRPRGLHGGRTGGNRPGAGALRGPGGAPGGDPGRSRGRKAAAANSGQGAQLPGLDAVLVELYEPREPGRPSLPPQPGRPTATAPRWMYGSFQRPADGVAEALSGALGGQLSRIVRLGLFHPETQCTDPAAFAGLKHRCSTQDSAGSSWPAPARISPNSTGGLPAAAAPRPAGRRCPGLQPHAAGPQHGDSPHRGDRTHPWGRRGQCPKARGRAPCPRGPHYPQAPVPRP